VKKVETFYDREGKNQALSVHKELKSIFMTKIGLLFGALVGPKIEGKKGEQGF